MKTEHFSPDYKKPQESNPKLLLTMALIALSISVSEKATAQYLIPYNTSSGEICNVPKTDPNTMEIENPHIKDKNVYEGVKKLVLEQREEVIAYLKSARYLELLLREFSFINDPKLNEKLDSLKNTPVGTRINLDQVFPEPDTSKLTSEQVLSIIKLRDQRVKDIEDQPWIIIDDQKFFDSISKGSIGAYITPPSGMYYGDIQLERVVTIKCPLDSNAIRTPWHEFIHQLLNGNEHILPLTKGLINIQNITNNEYLKSATEVMARVGVFKKCLKDEGVCDPFVSDVKEEDIQKYEQLRNKMKEGEEEFNIDQLFKTLNKRDILWFLNNTAAVPEMIPNDRYLGLMKADLNSRYT